MRHLLLLCLGLAIAPLRAPAQEFIEVPGPLTDDAFYRLVACAAPPGGDCAKPFIFWSEAQRLSLRVGIVQIDRMFADYRFDLVDAALDEAIAEINGVGAHLFLERAYEPPFDVPVYLVAARQGGRIEGTGVPELDGSDIAIARVAIRSRGPEITAAAIAISADIRRREIASVVLEELVQSLGLVTDIASPAYGHSIFAETGNSTVRLRGQDAAALRRHYPRL